jgi:hypothetical protein
VSQLRKTIKEELNTINYSDLPDGRWSNKKGNLKQDSIPEVIAKVQVIYTRYAAALKKIRKTYENVIVKEMGMKPDEASYLLGEMEEHIHEGDEHFDMMASTMGMDYPIFDDIESLKQRFLSFRDFKENVEKLVRTWQDKIGEAEDEEGFIGDRIEYDEDSEELLQMYFQGMSPEQVFQKIMNDCGLEQYLTKTKKK